MSEIKTKVTTASVTDFIQAVENPTRRADGFKLLEIFSRITGEPAKMWGPTMVGFGQYHYKSERSSQEGDWMMTGFSPRKASLTLYVLSSEDYSDLLAKLGKHKTSVACLYINKLADVNMDVLEELIARSWAEMQRKYGTN